MNIKHFSMQLSTPAQRKVSFLPLKVERSQKMMGRVRGKVFVLVVGLN